MPILDLHPGYLDTLALAEERAAVTTLIEILEDGRSAAPDADRESPRWSGHGGALRRRQALLDMEREVRGVTLELAPRQTALQSVTGPPLPVAAAAAQFAWLARRGGTGRIPLPAHGQILWAQHKYSVMARDPGRYRELGRRVATLRASDPWDDLARELVEILRLDPPAGRLRNAIDHMWGHVSTAAAAAGFERVALEARGGLAAVHAEIVRWRHQAPYIHHSTALSDLALHIGEVID